MPIADLLTTTHWMALGPAPINTPGIALGTAAGRIEAAAAHPKGIDVMYVAGGGGGVWKTTTWTGPSPSWRPLGDQERSLSVGGYHPLVVHPANPNLILAAASGAGGGVLKSFNGGNSWQLLGNATFEGAALGSLAVHPTDTKIIYVSVWWGVGGAGGIFKSPDGGLTWVPMTAFHAGGASDVVVPKADPETVYAGLLPLGAAGVATSGVYKSTTGGDGWDLQTGLESGAAVGIADAGGNVNAAIRLEAASTSGTVYVALFTNDTAGKGFVKRYRTANGGAAWVPLAGHASGIELRSWHLLLGVDPADDQHVFANAAYALLESTNGGKKWSRADVSGGKNIGDDWVNIAFDKNGGAVATSDQGVYRYDPKKNTWQGKEGDLQVTQFYDVTLDAANSDRLYGVGQDQRAAMRFDGAIDWAYIGAGGETGKVLVDPMDSSRIYVSNPLDPTRFVVRSENGGENWQTILAASDFVAEDYGLGYSVQRSFAMDPSNSARLLIGTTKVWETTNATAASPTWKAISDVLGGSTAAEQYITALAIAPSDPKTVYAATSDGHLWATTNGGGQWKARDAGLVGKAGAIVDIRIDPKNPKRAFAVGNRAGSVWQLAVIRNTLQWKNIAGDLPAHLRMTSIVADWGFAMPPLYLATSRGVYHSIDRGKHWTVFGHDMPNTTVSHLELGQGHALVAGTIGRGAWGILVPPSKIAGTLKVHLADGRVRPPTLAEAAKVILQPPGGDPDDFMTAVTDARGRYRFDRVPPGTYVVRRVVPRRLVALAGERERITVQGSDVRDLDFHFRAAAGGAPATAAPARAAARAAAAAPQPAAYNWVADLNMLPGRRPGQPIGGRKQG
jgi:photosystem II stability/assembly factor-like uncharacterized protein